MEYNGMEQTITNVIMIALRRYRHHIPIMIYPAFQIKSNKNHTKYNYIYLFIHVNINAMACCFPLESLGKTIKTVI